MKSKVVLISMMLVVSFKSFTNENIPSCIESSTKSGIQIDLNYQFPPTNSQELTGTCYGNAGLAAVASAIHRSQNPALYLNGALSLADQKNDFSPELTLMLLLVVSDDYLEERSEAKGFNDLFSSGRPNKLANDIIEHPEVLVRVAREDHLGFMSIQSVRSYIKSYFNKANNMSDRTKNSQNIRVRNEKYLSQLLSKLEADKQTSYITDTLKRAGFVWNSVNEIVNFYGTSRPLAIKIKNLFEDNIDENNCHSARKLILENLCKKRPVMLSFAVGIDPNFNISSHAVQVVGFESHSGESFLRLRDSAVSSDGNSRTPHPGISTINIKTLCHFTTIPTKNAEGKVIGSQKSFVLNAAWSVDPIDN